MGMDIRDECIVYVERIKTTTRRSRAVSGVS
jgi:hypothetical protein